MTNYIDEGNLPVKKPSGAANIRYEENGKSYKSAMPDVVAAAAIVQQEIDGIIADGEERLNQLVADAQSDIDAIVSGMGYLPPVAFASGLNVDSSRFTVTYDGVTYAPVADVVPFTTTDTFNSAQWRVIQGVTSADLGAVGAPALIGGKYAGKLSQAIDWVTPEMFGTLSGTDDTELFELAAAASPFIMLTPGTLYRVGDWPPPSGTTIQSYRGMGHFSGPNGSPPIVQRANGSSVNSVFDTRGKRELKFRGFHVKGGSSDGHVYDAHCIRVGGYIIVLEDMTVYEGLTGYGGQSGDHGQNTQIINCRFGNCVTGVNRIVDTTITGGSVTGCKTDGIALASGNNFNTIRTRLEWNGAGDSGLSVSEGYNLRITNAEDNLIDVTCDRSWLSGIRALGARNTTIRGVLRRSGAKNASSGIEARSHVYIRECENLTLDISTVASDIVDGSPSGVVTPHYGVTIDNSGAGNKNINIFGDLSGNTTSAVQEVNGRCQTLTILASGAQRVIDGVKFEAGKAIVASIESGNIAPAETYSATIYIPDSGVAFSTRPYKLRVTARNAAAASQQWFGEFPMLIAQAASGTAPVVSFGSISQEIAFSGGPNYISVGGSAPINITVGTLSVSNGSVAVPITIKNNSATITHKVRVELS